MIKPTILSRYLAGDATDEESQLCEEMLNEPGSVESLIGELEANPTDDSLLETLRNLENHSTQFNLENAEPKSLGKFDQCISNEGAISNPAMNKNLRVIQLRENRIETRGIEVLKP